VNPTTARRRARRAVLPLVGLAVVAALAAPAYADPPTGTDGTSTGTGKAVVALVVISNPGGERPPRTVVVVDPGSGPGKGIGPRVAVANPPPDNPPGPSVTGRTVGAVRNLSDKDPWPDPPPRSFGIEIVHPGGGGGPRVAVAGPPPDPDPDPPAVAGPPPVVVED
jgi:hypothetical protein